MTSIPNPSVGAKVVSADGKELGTVKEIKDGCFKVDVRMAPDYWLGTEIIDNTDEELVQLAITTDGLGEAKVRMPDIAELHPHN
jgi:hypothetical protein